MAKRKAKTKAVKVDFTGVEGKRSTLPDDDYLVEVESVEVKEGQKADYFELTLVVQSGPHKGSKIWDRASMAPNALWRLRSLLEVMGIEVPDGPLEIDPDDLVGCTFIAVTAQEAYKSDDGKKVAVRMVDFYSADEAEDEEDEDEDDESEDDDGEESDEDEDDGDEEDEEETPEERKKRLRRERRLARKKAEQEAESDEDEDEDDEEEEEKPNKKASAKKSTKKPAAKKPTAKKGKKNSLVSPDTVMEADEDELEELIEEHGLDVDLGDYKTLRKKQAAVIDALEDADLLEEE